MIKVNSFGGGVQSVAALVLQAQGKINYEYYIFSNVGDDSENPDTIKYYNEYALPFAEAHGISLVEVRRTRFGEPHTLIKELMMDNKSVRIPVRMSNGRPGHRSCTFEFKFQVVARWLRLSGHKKAVVGLNISTDEIERVHTPIWRKVSGIEQLNDYPLIDLMISRNDCYKLITEAGLPIPPKSACYFCPFHSYQDWKIMRSEKPDLFQKAVELERWLNYKRQKIGKDSVYLNQRGIPLDQAVGIQENFLDVIDNCESGYCMV